MRTLSYLLEAEATHQSQTEQVDALVSIAISLKRVADALSPANVEDLSLADNVELIRTAVDRLGPEEQSRTD